MRRTTERFERYRTDGLAHTRNGAFKIDGLFVGISDGEGWDHVSVLHFARDPTWDEMCVIKNVFFRPDEVVMQLHPAEKDKANLHGHCLHLWRPQTIEEIISVKQQRLSADLDWVTGFPTPNPIPLPPRNLV